VTYATVTVLGAGAAGASTEAVNPILPVDNELFWGGLMFLVLWALMKWVFLPPVLRTIQARADIVRDDLAAADGARAQAVSESVAYDESLASARAEAMRIIEGARTEAEEERRVLVSAAEAEAARIRSEAAADIAAAKRAALADLREGVGSVAVRAASAVVDRPLDPADHQQVVQQYLDDVSSN
jgi:F-type H+-transporting ATPase subunit b